MDGPLYVVELVAPVPDGERAAVVARSAEALGSPDGKLRNLLARPPGPITHPTDRDRAGRIVAILTRAGARVRMTPVVGTADDARVFLSSTRWVPSPHDPPGEAVESALGDAEAPADPGAPEDRVPSARDWSAAELGFPTVADPPAPARARRRGVLLLALLLSLAAFAWVQARVGDEAPPSYRSGLLAYQRGAFAEARRAWLPPAEAGDARSQFMLGWLAQQGLGQPWSNRRAAVWYRRAAEQGQREAAYRLAELYLSGMGVEPDAAEARGLLTIAASGGLAEAQLRLAQLLMSGRGGEVDHAAALMWLERAAEQDHPDAKGMIELLRWDRGEVPPG